MPSRIASRVRWTAVWVLLVGWLVFIVLDWGGRYANVLLFLAIAALVYELLVAERPG